MTGMCEGIFGFEIFDSRLLFFCKNVWRVFFGAACVK